MLYNICFDPSAKNNSFAMQADKSYFDKDAPTLVIRSLFQKYDEDGNGVLSEMELVRFLEGDLGLSKSDVDLYTLILDKDGDKIISFDEFLSWFRSGEHFRLIDNNSRYSLICKAVDLFKKFDADNSETIDRVEFRNLMKSLGHTKIDFNKTLSQLDQNGDGVISFWEFLKWLNWVPIEDN